MLNLSQYDPRWGGISINGTRYSLASDGCFIVSLSMLTGETPDITLMKLMQGQAFQKGTALLLSDVASKVLGLEYNGRQATPPNHTCIVETDYNPVTPKTEQHFCVWTPTHLIDPLGARIRVHGTYPYKIKSYRLFKPKPNLANEANIQKNKQIWQLAEDQKATVNQSQRDKLILIQSIVHGLNEEYRK